MLRAVLLASLLLAAPALAQQPPPPESGKEAEELAREALDKLMRAMGKLIQSIPQYEMPEILPNGDIIIRRKHPPGQKPPPKEEKT